MIIANIYFNIIILNIYSNTPLQIVFTRLYSNNKSQARSGKMKPTPLIELRIAHLNIMIAIKNSKTEDQFVIQKMKDTAEGISEAIKLLEGDKNA